MLNASIFYDKKAAYITPFFFPTQVRNPLQNALPNGATRIIRLSIRHYHRIEQLLNLVLPPSPLVNFDRSVDPAHKRPAGKVSNGTGKNKE